MRERELKRGELSSREVMIGVAPHAGARIETATELRDEFASYVAPHAGARIETS